MLKYVYFYVRNFSEIEKWKTEWGKEFDNGFCGNTEREREKRERRKGFIEK